MNNHRLIAAIDLKSGVKLNATQSVGDVFSTPTSLLNVLVPNLFILAGVIFLVLLIVGGLGIISSGSAQAVEKGQKQVTTAIVGFLIMFAAYWVVQIIEFLTGIKILNSGL